jgi:hypothetical protein
VGRKWKPAEGGVELGHYTNKSSSCYDPDFDKAIRECHPSWFVDTAEEKKKELLAMPKGCERPEAQSRLGRSLAVYINPSQGSFDPDFAKNIKAKQLDWFNDAKGNKEKILAMLTGSKRPNSKTPLGRAFPNYITEDSTSYDAVFTKQIKERQPGWFVRTSVKKKCLLLAMPIGCERPVAKKHPLGALLLNYTSECSNCYDPDFTKRIKKRQPGWFVDTVAENKKKLLAMPIGCDRPIQKKHPLGIALVSYTCKGSCFDAGFTKKIKRRQPGWFNKVAGKKKQLLAMPIGCDKPSVLTVIGSALFCYTHKSKQMFDSDFTKRIKKRQPGWNIP